MACAEPDMNENSKADFEANETAHEKSTNGAGRYLHSAQFRRDDARSQMHVLPYA